MAMVEEICLRLCLLTRAAWEDDLPPVLTRLAFGRLLDAGALAGLTIRDVPEIPDEMLNRARMLLSRSAAVYDVLNAYCSRGYRVILPQDACWPKQLNRIEKSRRPHFLFIKGNERLLEGRLIAFAGSRDIEKETQTLAYDLGRRAAQEGLTVVCGDARGVDTAVLRGTLEHGGNAVLVPAKPAQQLLKEDSLAGAMEDGRFLLLCDALPDDRFSAPRAIARNHTIYALGGAAIVAAARERIGGSWHGAIDCIRGGYAPVWTIDGTGADYAGNRALLQEGAAALDPCRPLAEQCLWEPGYRQTDMFSEMKE